MFSVFVKGRGCIFAVFTHRKSPAQQAARSVSYTQHLSKEANRLARLYALIIYELLYFDNGISNTSFGIFLHKGNLPNAPQSAPAYTEWEKNKKVLTKIAVAYMILAEDSGMCKCVGSLYRFFAGRLVPAEQIQFKPEGGKFS